METTVTLRFLCTEPPASGSSSTVEHVARADRTPLCGAAAKGKAYDEAGWVALHAPRFHRQCPACRRAAVLILRPKAKFWYLDPFNGNRKEFGSLRSARASAGKEHGTSTVWQTGPGDVNRIACSVQGLDPLP